MAVAQVSPELNGQTGEILELDANGRWKVGRDGKRVAVGGRGALGRRHGQAAEGGELGAPGRHGLMHCRRRWQALEQA